ncbi:aldehyde:ferredoxin oxidoreductase [Symbiobacterium terraclitae]|uniref:Aldehyde:ferredoxin oxidoreductase n=1 Tax=Symbiobacterium terraclitae TaxID=557451 RepID=A0ABS4JUT3_9FIRM|nr:aldehyde ferredoxin oxidoreductase N-terminal domain-containing protein [Symbiobacterium terraclitae]MBP2019313.1 aldehyde:ferredoxin oxidoreductase [Symbiobacterium terraclitae]
MVPWEYAEQILYVDLTQRTARVEPTPLALKQRYIGGAGFVARLLADSSGARAGATPRVALATGPLSEEMAGRLALGAAWAPSRRGEGERRPVFSSMGGRMAAALKGAGYDAVVLDGELDSPGVLVIEPGGVRVLDAGYLTGLEVPDVTRELLLGAGPYWANMVLGPAAEKLVPFATMVHEGHFAGGSGVACALGTKRLKAVMVRDTQDVPARCTGCTLACPAKLTPNAGRAGDLGLDAPTADRLAAWAAALVAAGMLPKPVELLTEMAYRRGVGAIFADGEAAALERLGPEAARILPALPPPKKRGGIGVADLLGTCQRVWRERPGEVLRSALVATKGLLADVG